MIIRQSFRATLTVLYLLGSRQELTSIVVSTVFKEWRDRRYETAVLCSARSSSGVTTAYTASAMFSDTDTAVRAVLIMEIRRGFDEGLLANVFEWYVSVERSRMGRYTTKTHLITYLRCNVIIFLFIGIFRMMATEMLNV